MKGQTVCFVHSKGQGCTELEAKLQECNQQGSERLAKVEELTVQRLKLQQQLEDAAKEGRAESDKLRDELAEAKSDLEYQRTYVPTLERNMKECGNERDHLRQERDNEVKEYQKEVATNREKILTLESQLAQYQVKSKDKDKGQVKSKGKDNRRTEVTKAISKYVPGLSERQLNVFVDAFLSKDPPTSVFEVLKSEWHGDRQHGSPTLAALVVQTPRVWQTLHGKNLPELFADWPKYATNNSFPGLKIMWRRWKNGL